CRYGCLYCQGCKVCSEDVFHIVFQRCEVLKEYSLFIDTVRKYSKEEDSIKKAVQECMERRILADYLR
ncbi:MAG: hypothetical protein K1W32_19220, partial [Schaedlerella sp.]